MAYAYAAARPDEVRRLVLSEGVLQGISDWDMIKLSEPFGHFGFPLRSQPVTSDVVSWAWTRAQYVKAAQVTGIQYSWAHAWAEPGLGDTSRP